jgi:Fe-S-cluster-containing hydrogenase component 2
MADADPLVIRCAGCEETACAVSCGRGAVVRLRGDVLLEARKCGGCARYVPGGIPACIAACRRSETKTVAEQAAEQKRIQAADSLSLLRFER